MRSGRNARRAWVPWRARGGCGAVNPVAGDLAKPAIAWDVLVAVVNYKML
jgi:hypothetical protein